MSLEDLQRAGLLRPRQQWGKQNLHTTVNKPWLIFIGLVTLISTGLMYWGDGALMTWIGVGMFLIGLVGFTLLSIYAVEKQQHESTPEGETDRGR